MRGAEPDCRIDIYTLGLILNEMFTGEIAYAVGYKTISSVAPEFEYLEALVAEMLRQTPNERPSTIEVIKRQLIGRKNEFINMHRLNVLEETVIPVSEVDDPIISDPPRLIDKDWNDGMLTLIFSRPVNENWVWALKNMGTFSTFGHYHPTQFRVSGDRAMINARDTDVQAVIDQFKGWLPRVNQVYEAKIRREIREAEEKTRKELEAQVAMQEARQRVLRDVRI